MIILWPNQVAWVWIPGRAESKTKHLTSLCRPRERRNLYGLNVIEMKGVCNIDVFCLRTFNNSAPTAARFKVTLIAQVLTFTGKNNFGWSFTSDCRTT